VVRGSATNVALSYAPKAGTASVTGGWGGGSGAEPNCMWPTGGLGAYVAG